MNALTVSLTSTSSLVVDGIQGTVETTIEQYLATVALGLSFLVAVWIIFLGGPALKRRYSDEVVDIARTVTIMIVALASAGVFVVIWNVQSEVWDALGVLRPNNPEETAVLVFVAFLVLLGTYVLSRVTKRAVRRWSETGRISPHQRELAHHAIQIGLFVVAIIFIFGLFNQSPRDLFLGAGVVGVVLGFAARKTLSGVLSGFVILFGRPFEAGDWIAVGDREGIVTDISVFNTQIRTFNEEHVLVPNDRVTESEVINYSKTDRLRLVTEVGVDYDVDIDEAATIAKETIEDCDAVADSPGPDVVLESFADSAVVLQLRYWIDTPTIQRKLSAQNQVIDAVKKAFEDEGIKIPYPQRELLGREETDGLRVNSDSDAEVAVDDDLERAVRHVRADSTTIEEPVEDRYRDDDEMEGDPEEARGDDEDTDIDAEAEDVEDEDTDTEADDAGGEDVDVEPEDVESEDVESAEDAGSVEDVESTEEDSTGAETTDTADDGPAGDSESEDGVVDDDGVYSEDGMVDDDGVYSGSDDDGDDR